MGLMDFVWRKTEEVRGRVWRRGSAYEGTHKGCPYGGVEGAFGQESSR